MANVVVVGMHWGDEAKGKVVDYLAQDADYVVRYNGGNNAGHTVVVGEEVFKFHVVPVGVLHEHVTPVIADGVVVDPKVFLGEVGSLSERGISTDKIKMSANAHIIMPYHRLLDSLEETLKGENRIGTTGRGIGPCYADKMSRTGIRVCDLIDPDRFRRRLADVLGLKNAIITKVYGGEAIDENAVYEEYVDYGKRIAPYVCDTSALLHQAANECRKIVFEGAHATLLDIDSGTYPYVTSSHCVAGGATLGTGVGATMIDRVIGVAKAYTTRVGEGPCPTELKDSTGDRIRERGKEYGTTTGRPRRCGWFDAVAARYSARVNGAASIAVSLLDVLSGFSTVKICRAYSIDGRTTEDFPCDPEVLARAVPVYEELPGWSEEIDGARSFAELPSAARNYVARLADLTQTPVCMLSVGRQREQTIVLDPEMLDMEVCNA